MISYQKINRWLKKPLDPITVEDWLGNREIFGPAKNPDDHHKELERAFELELIRNGKFGIFELEDILLVAPQASGEAWLYGEKVEKIDLPSGRVITKILQWDKPFRIKIKIKGKPDLEWSGEKKEKIIFDS